MEPDPVQKIMQEAFDAAHLQRLSDEIERFLATCDADPRVGPLTTGHYGDVLRQFRRFAQYGTRRFS